MASYFQNIEEKNINSSDILSELNPEQQEAVEQTEGALLVLAGAGTGKTRVLTTRLAHLLKSGVAKPHQIMAATFTNKAAMEMKERVSELLGGVPIDGWWIGTFHSLAARMLRQNAEKVSLSSNFTILDMDDQMRLVKQIAELEGVDTKKFPPRLLMSFIDNWKNKALLPENVSVEDAGDAINGKMIKIYHLYQSRLKSINACDFNDLLLHMIVILKNPEHKDVLDLYHDQFRYLLIDEYQDTNTAQYLWLRLLAQKNKNVCCVGDDDQSIYGWRGAEVENILRFEKDFPNAKIVRLEQNYRSTPQILNAANAVISNNRNRMGKKLWSAGTDGEKIHLQGVWDGRQEAVEISGEIEALKQKDVSLSNVAILVRAGFQTREFEERFMTIGLPYKVIGGPRFYERREIRDALAYFRLVVQPSDDLAFERIINTPKRGVGSVALRQLYEFAREHGISLYDSCLALTKTTNLKPRLRATLLELIDNFERWRALLSEEAHTQTAKTILEESGYINMWKTDKSIEAEGRLENLEELTGAMAEFENMQDFLEHVSLVMEVQKNTNQAMVTIMTLHGSKGLEFDYVFLPGWEEGTFPSQRSIDEGNLEEERRLAYVGLTRAKKKLHIFHASNRLIFGSWKQLTPSRFIGELPEDIVEATSENGFYRGHQSCSSDSFSINQGNSTRAVISTTSNSFTNNIKGSNQVGHRVSHTSFGSGTIVGIEGDKLEVKFDRAGRKKIMARFVEFIT